MIPKLTVNEMRKRLGLRPIVGGERQLKVKLHNRREVTPRVEAARAGDTERPGRAGPGAA